MADGNWRKRGLLTAANAHLEFEVWPGRRRKRGENRTGNICSFFGQMHKLISYLHFESWERLTDFIKRGLGNRSLRRDKKPGGRSPGNPPHRREGHMLARCEPSPCGWHKRLRIPHPTRTSVQSALTHPVKMKIVGFFSARRTSGYGMAECLGDLFKI